MKHSVIESNKAWLGGGISMGRNSNAVFEDNVFHGNYARTGGAVHVSQNQYVTIFTRCRLESNMARFGAAMFLEFSKIRFVDGIASSNVATLYGTVRLAGNAEIEVVNSRIEYNRAHVGAALYANDATKVSITLSTLNGNVALEDAGAVYIDDSTSLVLDATTVMNNRAIRGDGGGVVRRGGARANVTMSTFTSNTAGRRGGGMDQHRLMCRDSTACGILFDGVMSIENYTACLSGRPIHGANVPPHVTCTTVTSSAFNKNQAKAGAGIFWSNAYEYDAALQLPHVPSLVASTDSIDSIASTGSTDLIGSTASADAMDGNTFENNRLSSCRDDDSFIDSFPCTSDIGSDSSSVGVGWTPGQVGYVPGVPMQNSSFTSSVHHKSTASHVFLTTLDYYGKVYRLDQTTTCVIQRKCDNDQFTYNRQSGKCAGAKLGTMDSYAIHLTGNEALAVNGRILFSDLIVRATPQPNETYSITFNCKIYNNDNTDGIDGAGEGGTNTTVSEASNGNVVLEPVLQDVLRIKNCEGGTQLTNALSCQTCIPGRYSHDGKGCTECPSGGECSQTVQQSTTQVVTIGEIRPKLMEGYWVGETPTSWKTSECNADIIASWESNTCPPGEKLANAGSLATESNAGNDNETTCIDAGWDKDRIHRCRTGLHLYECLTKVACTNRSLNIATYVVPNGYQAGDAIVIDVNTSSKSGSSSASRRLLVTDSSSTQFTFVVPPGKVPGDVVKQEYGNETSICMLGYTGPKCGVCANNYTKDGANVCNKCAGGDVYASQAIYGTSIVAILFAAIGFIVIYLRDGGFQCMKKIKKIKHPLLHLLCCKCCDHCCCKLCRRLSHEEHAEEAKMKLRRASMIQTKSFFGKRATSGDFKGLNEALTDHIEADTVWFRPEKFKIILSFLQVFQEYRRTYRIKWPQVVQDYMDFFSSLVDFDIFRLVSVDCIAPITHLNKVVGFVLLPIVALIGKYSKATQEQCSCNYR